MSFNLGHVTEFKHCIVQIFGGGKFGELGKPNVIHQYFTQPNSTFTKVANAIAIVNSPTFSLAKTLK